MTEQTDGYPFDDEDPDDTSEDCPECGASPCDRHEPDCSRGDDDDE